MAGMTGLCGGLAGPTPEADLCRPGWEHLPTDLRRLLAETWGAVVDGDPDGPALHECAHILAAEFRAGQWAVPRPQYTVARYHDEMQAARGELHAVREAS
jgi:hypothetical protein